MADKSINIRIRVDGKEYESAIARAERATKGLGAGARGSAADFHLLSSAADSFVAIGGGVAATFAAWNLLQRADQFQTLQTRIQTATKATGDYAEVSARLFRISQDNGVALQTSVELFQSLARAAPELAATNGQMLQLTSLVQQLGVIGGSTQAQMDNGLLQFSQAMSGGVLRAEEFNSILENIPELGARIASGMGMTVGELRNAVLEGRVLSRDVFDSLIDQAPQIADEFEAIPLTLDRAATSLGNSISRALSQLDEAVGTSETIARSLSNWARAFDEPSDNDRFQTLTRQIMETRDAIEQMERARDSALFGFRSASIQEEIDALEQNVAALEAKRDAMRAAREEQQRAESEALRAAEEKALADEQAAALSALTEARQREAEALARQAADLDQLVDRLLPARAALREFREQEEALLQAIQRFPGSADTYREALKALRDQYHDTGEAAAEVMAEIRDDWDLVLDMYEQEERANARLWASREAGYSAAKGAVKDLADDNEEKFGKMEAAVNGWGNAFTDTLADMVVSGKASFGDLADSIIRDLLRIMIQRQITAPLLEAGQGFLSGLIPGLATGGNFPSGSVRLVGERGPELMYSRAGGTVVPNDRVGGALSGGGDVRVVLDNRGAPKQASHAEAQFDGQGMVVRVMIDDVQRGGPLSGALEGAYGLRRSVR